MSATISRHVAALSFSPSPLTDITGVVRWDYRLGRSSDGANNAFGVVPARWLSFTQCRHDGRATWSTRGADTAEILDGSDHPVL